MHAQGVASTDQFVYAKPGNWWKEKINMELIVKITPNDYGEMLTNNAYKLCWSDIDQPTSLYQMIIVTLIYDQRITSNQILLTSVVYVKTQPAGVKTAPEHYIKKKTFSHRSPHPYTAGHRSTNVRTTTTRDRP